MPCFSRGLADRGSAVHCSTTTIAATCITNLMLLRGEHGVTINAYRTRSHPLRLCWASCSPLSCTIRAFSPMPCQSHDPPVNVQAQRGPAIGRCGSHRLLSVHWSQKVQTSSSPACSMASRNHHGPAVTHCAWWASEPHHSQLQLDFHPPSPHLTRRIRCQNSRSRLGFARLPISLHDQRQGTLALCYLRSICLLFTQAFVHIASC